MWKAADVYDRAGERDRAIGVLERFVQERPQSVRVSEALFRLGQSLSALQRYTRRSRDTSAR